MHSYDYRIYYSVGKEDERVVGIILDRQKVKTVEGFMTISDHVLLVKSRGKPRYINTIQFSEPTADSQHRTK